MKIDQLARPTGDTAYYDPDFMVILESHLTYLLGLSTTQTLAIEPADAVRFEGDLFGVLDKFNIAKQYHYAVMLVNGYRSPTDFTKDTYQVIVPDTSEIDILKQRYKTKKVNM